MGPVLAQRRKVEFLYICFETVFDEKNEKGAGVIISGRCCSRLLSSGSAHQIGARHVQVSNPVRRVARQCRCGAYIIAFD